MRSILLIFILTSTFSNAQSYFSEHFGGSVGVVLNMGTHVDAIGINVKGYYTDFFYQFNTGTTFTFHPKSYGNRKKFWQSRTVFGAVLLAGKREQVPNPMLDGLNHQTSYNLGLAYNFLLYYDNAGTSQRSGAWGFHINRFSLMLENDFFGGRGEDRYRTGIGILNYRYQDWTFSLGTYVWTGDSRRAKWQRIPMKNTPNGFCILENEPYGRTSHGIIYASATRHFDFRQSATLRLGMDSENFRHAFQNRTFHDVFFLPQSLFKRSTPHYPRLDENGCATFDKNQARKNKFYFQLNANDNWSF